MSLPDVSDVLREWEQDVTIKTITEQTTDFVDQSNVTPRSQKCVVQVADKEQLNPDTIDWSREYLLVHSRSNIAIDELIEFQGKDYRVTPRGGWNQYGFVEVVAEETKEPLQ